MMLDAIFIDARRLIDTRQMFSLFRRRLLSMR